MRLLQMAMGPDDLIDLHPLVSVVTGLDGGSRLRLRKVLTNMAASSVDGAAGLLEAHGVLFDLSAESLELLEIRGEELQPVVVADDLPTIIPDPARRARSEAEALLGAVDGRRAAARTVQLQAQAVLTAAHDAVERARAAHAAMSNQSAPIEELRASYDAALRERQRLEAQRDGAAAAATSAGTALAELSESVASERGGAADVAARLADVGARVERLRAALDPQADDDHRRAVEDLTRVTAEVEAERSAEAPASPVGQPGEEPMAWVERLEERIAEIEKGLAAFEPDDTSSVAAALAAMRPGESANLHSVPEALALADELDAIEVEALEIGGASEAAAQVAGARTRLDDARRSLEEAELGARNPELDRDVVNNLELAHADLLDAIDKADSRFGGARAQRRVEMLREAETVLLDQLGFSSYSDYMMGYSLLNVDPAAEDALEAARAELSSAEDLWQSLEVEAEAELGHAEGMARRRALLERAAELLDRAVPAAEAIGALRALRVEVEEVASTDELRRALDAVGLAVGDDELDAGDLVAVAEAWLDEVASAPSREEDLRAELSGLQDELTTAQAAADRGAAPPEPTGPSAEELRSARLDHARDAVQEAVGRRDAHHDAARDLEAVIAELADAEEAERQLAPPAEGDGEPLAAATEAAETAQAELDRLEEELVATIAAERDAHERVVEAGGDGSGSPLEAVAAALESAERDLLASTEGATAAAQAVAELEAEHREAAAALDGLGPAPDPGGDGTVAEEIEWYILARLAAQRSVSLGGSLPLMIDDALGGLPDDDLTHLLGRLERMAQAVQIIVVSDDNAVRTWAHGVGVDRAAVVERQTT